MLHFYMVIFLEENDIFSNIFYRIENFWVGNAIGFDLCAHLSML